LSADKKSDYKEFDSFIKFTKLMDKIITKFSNDLSFARAPSDLSLQMLKKSYSNISVGMIKLNKLIKRIVAKANSRLEYSKYIKDEMKQNMNSLTQSDKYTLNYKSFQKKWKKYDNKAATGGPSSVSILII
jgi:hypothetical protein